MLLNTLKSVLKELVLEQLIKAGLQASWAPVSSVMRGVSINTNMSCAVNTSISGSGKISINLAILNKEFTLLNMAELNDRDRASTVRAVIYDGSKILISYFELLYLNCTSATLNRSIIAILQCYEINRKKTIAIVTINSHDMGRQDWYHEQLNQRNVTHL
ncbi:hypothetical protein T02_14380 [Trichinella nativa]|uniref:Uncharacterized protein n=1 Tax=Trichinella nativa TaxID=6335 RepID=A0A0V1LRN9_9BILA|nr:hypothetical protein T02_14380 [Trichinella nativa]